MKKYLAILAVLLIGAFSSSIAQNVNVTFQVDMSYQIATQNFDPAATVVTCPGGFNNWLNEPPANTEKVMTDADGDKIYTLTVAMAANNVYEYKYNIGTGWDGKDEGSNRSVTVGASDMTLDVVSYNNAGTANGQPATVTFSVDMSLPEQQGTFVPGTDPVWVAGSFTDWQNAPFELKDADGDKKYTGTFTKDHTGADLVGGNTLMFKFIYKAANFSWESVADRKLILKDGEQSFSAFWDDQDPNITLANGTINFNIDMSVMTEIGLFDPAVDSTHIRGGFNGWSSDDAAKSHMNQDFLNPNDWFIGVPFVQQPVGAEQSYKYYVQLVDNKKDKAFAWADGYERPLSQGGGNRDAIFEGTDTQAPGLAYYDDVHPDYVVPAGQSVEITFSVNMTDAANPEKQVPTFIPGTDKVFWISEQPAFTYSQGWEDTDDMAVLEMTDADGDKIYTATLTVNGPSWNGFEYRYAFTKDGSYSHEPSGFGDFAYRVRYIDQTAARTFVQPYSAPGDTWTTTENKSDQWESGPKSYTDVKPLDLVANSFELNQNYPNPFNPSTVIRFSIPADNKVVVKVFNVIGQEVSTLMNQDMKAGSYEVKLNAQNWSSGVYFYSIQAGNYTATRKMMLLK